MNTRIFSIVVAATLMTVSTGCSGMRNFLFGRGARCGLCSSATAPAPAYTSPAPTYTAPAPNQYQPAPYSVPANQYAAPAPCQSAPPAYQNQRSRCGLRNWFGWGRNVSPPAQAPCQGGCQGYSPCTSCYGSDYLGDGGSIGDCGCGGDCGSGGATSIVTDPYMVQPGQIIDGNTVIQEDDFSARRFDADGARIIWEDPATEL